MSNVIVSFSRTPIGSFLGSLESVSSPKLGATAIAGAVTKANLDLKQITQVIMGSVLPAGVGQAPARQAAIYSGLSDAVNCLTINKMCGSGLESIILADQLIKNNPNEIIVAGGMENMSQAPHYLLNSRSGTRLGEGKLVDGMIVDGLWDIYNDKHMGNCAEMCAEKFSISREEQDDFAIKSYERSQASISNGTFDNEIIPVDINTRKGVITIDKDEEPHRVSFEKLKSLRTVFQKDGTITAGNASTINDGAAACLIMSEDKSKELGMTPIARIIDYSSHSHDPEWFTTAPIFSTQKVLKQQNIKASEIDIYEINEAFSVVTLATMKELNLDPQKVNPYGGAVSLGHPIGASGARIMCTLLNSMISKDKKMGVSSICIGGGEALSVLVERIN